MKLPISTPEQVLEAKKYIWFNYYRINSYNFYLKYKDLIVVDRWNQLIERTFHDTDKIVVDEVHRSWADLFLLFFVDKKIDDPICLTWHRDNTFQLEPGIKRLLCIPYLPKHIINYVIFKDKRPENRITWCSNDAVLQVLLNENIPAHFTNSYYMARCRSLYTTKSVIVEKFKDEVYINGQKTFAVKDNNWQICLPNLMEDK
jgi:hypothetical protein